MKQLIENVANMIKYSDNAIDKLTKEREATLNVRLQMEAERDALCMVSYADTSSAIAEINKSMNKQKEHLDYLTHLIEERARERSNYKSILASLAEANEELNQLRISRVVGVVNG